MSNSATPPGDAHDGSPRLGGGTLSVRISTGAAGGARLVVAGELDANSAAAFSDSLLDAVRTGDVVVDLCGVTFMASAGLAAFLRARESAAGAGSHLVLVVPRHHRAVRRPFDLMGLTPMFTIVAPDEPAYSGSELCGPPADA